MTEAPAQKGADGDLVRPMMAWMSRATDANELIAKGNAFIGQFPASQGLKVASALAWANPFFVPNVDGATVGALSLSSEQLAHFLMRAKQTARTMEGPKILLACAPKSASTFLQTALTQALGLNSACLFAATFDWASAAVHGSGLVEQEPDELALIRAGLNGRPYVAQHHCRATPYLARLLSTYRLSTIVSHRNIFDTIVSMDDMLIDWRSRPGSSQHGYFTDGMPGDYERRDPADRLLMLAQRHVPWLLQFYLSWRKCARNGEVSPLFVSYEADFLGDKQALAERMANHLGLDAGARDRLVAAFEDKSDGRAKRLNRGIAGRGAALPDAVRAQILSTASYYRDEDDLTPLLGRT